MANFRTQNKHFLRVYNPNTPRPDGRQGQLWANSTGVGPDEEFEVVQNGDAFGLRIWGKFVSMQPNGTIEVNRTELRGWERFRLVAGENGGQGIRSVDWGFLLAAEGGGGANVTTRSYDTPRSWESFYPSFSAPGGTGKLYGPLRRVGPRGLGDDRGARNWVALSRFYHGSEILMNPDRVKRDADNDVAAEYDAARVMFQVGSLGGGDYWDGHIADPNHPRYEEGVRQILDIYRERGLRVGSACLIGKGNGMHQQNVRRSHVQRLARIFKDYGDVILIAQMMNEPGIMGEVTIPELLELEALFRQIAPNIVTSTGADGTEDGPGGYEADSYGQVGTPHLDRDQTASEMQDRPWRQPWDTGLTGHSYFNDEPIGPRASVAEETRPNVLRSHALVSFIARATGYVFHADEGIRGNGDLTQVPGYREVPRCRRFLPEGMANGDQVNSNSNFPNRHWDLDPKWYRAGNGNRQGIVRCYGNQIGGKQYTVPFGPVSDFELIAQRALRVQCHQQDLDKLLWERLVGPGEVVRFVGDQPDYLLVSTAL